MAEPEQVPQRAAQVGWTGGVLSWLATGTAISVLMAVVKIGTWVNHWYIAERFYYDESQFDEATRQGLNTDIIELLRSGNGALLSGLVWLLVALLCVLAAIIVRRRRSRRSFQQPTLMPSA